MTDQNSADGARALGRKVRSWIVHIFGGRYSHGAWLVSTLIYISAAFLVVLPLSTFLWTSPRPLRDLYSGFAIAVAVLALLGLVLAYAKRLQDQGRIGLWAVGPLIAVPWALISAATAWGEQVWEQDHSTSSTDYVNIALAVSFLILIVVALLPARATERFGPRVSWKDVLGAKRVPVLLLSVVIAVGAAVTVYAGHVQDGIWVRRAEREYDTGSISKVGQGVSFATCGGAKGVAAFSQQGQSSGFVRDTVQVSWTLVKLPNGTFDIQTFGKNGNLSYREDGFEVEAPGLEVNDIGQVSAATDSFQVIAHSLDQVGDVQTVLTMTFAKQEYQYQAVITSARLIGKNSMVAALSSGHPRASAFVMLADCQVFHS